MARGKYKKRKNHRLGIAPEPASNPLAPDPEGFDEHIMSREEAREAQIATLDKETAKELKRRCKAQNLPLRSRDTKMSAILLLMGEHPRQHSDGDKLIVPEDVG